MQAIEAVADRDRRLWPFNGFAHSGRHAEAPDAKGYLATPTVHPVCSPRASAQAASQHADVFQQQQQQEQTQQQEQIAEVTQQQQQAVGGLPPCKKHKAVDAAASAGDGSAAAAPQHAGGTAGTRDGSSSSQAEAADAAAAPGAPSNATNGRSAPAAAADATAANGTTDWARKPYLCTGYDCFLAVEPCIMCSMAMVHSRLARVVYSRADAQHGALGGKLRLHAQRSLNHHYLVYHMPNKAEQQQQ
jgi:tRNA(Arg) A34 adenosine deaminase TadA